MNRQDLFERILASLHAGVLNDAQWPATAGLIDELCGVKGNHLVFGDGEPPEDIDIFFAQFCYRGQRHVALEREYFGSWHAVDERLPRVRTLPDSQLTPTPSLFSEDEMRVSAVYNELMPRTDTRDCLTVRLDGPDRSRIVWTVANPIDGDGWTSDRVGSIERLLPHMRQFVRARQALAGARALGATAIELLDNVRVGVVQLDRRGRLVAANDRTRALLRQGDGLSDEAGRLRASLPDDDATLQRLLARALAFPRGPGAGGSMLVSRLRSLSRLVLHVSPMDDAGADPVRGGAGALVLVVDPADRPSIDPQRVGEALNLTRAQSQVAVLLGQGKSIDEVSAQTGRRRTTIKWHIRHIYERCRISRRTELVQLISSLAEIPGTRG